MVAKMPTIVGYSSNATTHEIYLIFRLSIKGKIVSIHCNKSKTLGRSPSTPSSLYHGGVWICVCVRALTPFLTYKAEEEDPVSTSNNLNNFTSVVVLAIDYSNFFFYYSFWFALCKGIWIPESRGFFIVESGIQQTFIVESGILRFGIRNIYIASNT